MNKSDFITQVQEKVGIASKKEATQAVDAVLDTLSGLLEKGDSVTFPGFGSFKVTQRAARESRNPRTGEPLKIPATRVVKFQSGKTLKEKVAASGK